MKLLGYARRVSVILFLLVGLSSCAPLDSFPLAGPRGEAGTTVTADRFRTVPENRLHDHLNRADIVYVGEQHDNSHSHRVQATIIEALYARNPDLSIGLELFRENQQELLDEWIAGNLTEEEFENRMSEEEGSSPLFSYYAGVLRFARKEKIPLLALKPTRRDVDDFRQSLPSEPIRDGDTSPQARFLRKTFEGHVSTKRGFRGYLAVQRFWEERMARNIHRFLSRDGSPGRMVVLTGNFHVAYDFGIPDKLARLGDYRQKSVLTLPVDRPLSETFLLEPSVEEKTNRADYVRWVPPKNSDDE